MVVEEAVELGYLDVTLLAYPVLNLSVLTKVEIAFLWHPVFENLGLPAEASQDARFGLSSPVEERQWLIYLVVLAGLFQFGGGH